MEKYIYSSINKMCLLKRIDNNYGGFVEEDIIVIENEEDNSLKWVNVISSNLEKVAYEEKDRILYVAFKKNKNIYFYSDVPVQVYNEFLMARSKGKFFYNFIKFRYKFGAIM